MNLRDRLRGWISRYLWIWARFVLARRRPLVIGITGTVGKTTTKEMIAATLQTREARDVLGVVWYSIANMNDDIGVPLAILGERAYPSKDLNGLRLALFLPFRTIAYAFWRPYPDVLVLEFGAGARGNVPANARRARPGVAIVTTVGPAHLEHFGTVEEVARFKAGLVDAVQPDGLVILGADNPFLELVAGRSSAPVVTVVGRGPGLSAEVARALGQHLGVPSEAVERAIAGFGGVAGRQQALRFGDVVVIDDAFNANPLSMRYGLELLAAEREPTRRVAILGSMGELGADAERHHAEIAPFAAESAELLVGVGELARAYRPHHWFASSAECAEAIDELIRPGDVVLVKGSHAVGMDRIVDALGERWSEDAEPT